MITFLPHSKRKYYSQFNIVSLQSEIPIHYGQFSNNKTEFNCKEIFMNAYSKQVFSTQTIQSNFNHIFQTL